MATANVLNTTLFALYSGTTKIAKATGASLSLSMETRDITTKDSSGWKEILEGLRSGSFSCEALMAFDSAYGYNDFLALKLARTPLTVKFSTGESGDSEYSGNVYLTGLELNSSGSEDNVTYSTEFELNGAVTTNTIS